jgi:hypothetical protein
MAARYILAIVGLVFLAAGTRSAIRIGISHPQSRGWLLVGMIMTAVSFSLSWLVGGSP